MLPRSMARFVRSIFPIFIRHYMLLSFQNRLPCYELEVSDDDEGSLLNVLSNRRTRSPSETRINGSNHSDELLTKEDGSEAPAQFSHHQSDLRKGSEAEEEEYSPDFL